MKNSLAAASVRRSAMARLAQQALACTFFAALVAVFARIAIPLPFTPVPFSMGPLGIMLTGMFLGSGPAFFALLEYVVSGALGAPVFVNGNGGLTYMVTVSSLGYLLAYPPAAYVIGWIAERSNLKFGRLLLAGLAGLLVIYAGGDAYLALWLHGDVAKALVLGTVPFILFDLVKAAVAAGVATTTPGNWFTWHKR
ncbi:MAG TPA: biotin transporter BioY [Chloroflexota bacterium]|nr:biotin transporter BioY [Chloroflexota bacterium]